MLLFRLIWIVAFSMSILTAYGQLSIYGDCAGDNFGYSVGVSGDGSRMIVGATLNDGFHISGCAADINLNIGRTKVFELDGSNWIQIGQDIHGLEIDARSGSSVDISADGNRIIIGDRLDDFGGPNSNTGLIRVFEWDGVNEMWLQIGNNITGSTEGGNFGTSVSISADGKRIAAGAPYGLPNVQGAAIVYEWQDVAWIQISYVPGVATNEILGQSLDLSEDGRRLIVGVYGYDDQRGAARIYQINDTGWEFIGELIGEEVDVLFGWTVSISGDGERIIVGAPFGDSGQGTYDGSIQMYEYAGDNLWQPLGATLFGDSTMSGFGGAVSMSDNGSVIAVGAGLAENQGGQRSGKVYAYQWNGSEWIQFDNVIEGISDLEGFGRVVDLSGDGTTIAIGAPHNDNTSNDAGRAATAFINPVIPFNVACMDITVNLGPTGEITLPGISVDDGSSSPNGIQSYSVTPDFFTCGDRSQHNVVLTVTDNDNIIDTCHAIVTIADANYYCCYSSLVIDDNPILSLTYKTSTSITSAGVLPISGNAIYSANSAIFLENNFQIDSGGVFHCVMNGCSP